MFVNDGGVYLEYTLKYGIDIVERRGQVVKNSSLQGYQVVGGNTGTRERGLQIIMYK